MCKYFGLGREESRFGRGPAWYTNHSHGLHQLNDFLKTSQVHLPNFWMTVGLCTFYSLFLLLVLTARGRKISTVLIGSVCIFTLHFIALGFTDNEWSVAEDKHFMSSYCQFNHSLIVKAKIKVSVGLRSFNVSYSGQDFDYNEYFELEKLALKSESLRRGLPNPVTVIVEYFSVENNVGMFKFVRNFAPVGWYAQSLLCGSLGVFGMGSGILIYVPRYFPYMSLLNGTLLLVTCLYYYLAVGDLGSIYVEGISLVFHLGRTYYMTLAAAIGNLVAAIMIPMACRLLGTSMISTFMEVDYDTAYNAKRIKEDSKTRRAAEEVKPPPEVPNPTFAKSSFFRASVVKFRKSVRNFRGKNVEDKLELATSSMNSEDDVFKLSSLSRSNLHSTASLKSRSSDRSDLGLS